MATLRMLGVLVLVAGILGAVVGSFDFTKETHKADFAGLELSVDEQQTVNIPLWLSSGAIVVGGLMLAVGVLRR